MFPELTCRGDAAYRVCRAAEVPVKSAQKSAPALVLFIELPKRICSPAEGFLLSCVLGKEMQQRAIS